MFRNIIFVLMYHRHKLLDIICESIALRLRSPALVLSYPLHWEV
jgi:hypothetical protein